MKVTLLPHPDGALLVLPPEIAPKWWQEGAEVKLEIMTMLSGTKILIISLYANPAPQTPEAPPA